MKWPVVFEVLILHPLLYIEQDAQRTRLQGLDQGKMDTKEREKRIEKEEREARWEQRGCCAIATCNCIRNFARLPLAIGRFFNCRHTSLQTLAGLISARNSSPEYLHSRLGSSMYVCMGVFRAVLLLVQLQLASHKQLASMAYYLASREDRGQRTGNRNLILHELT